MRILVEVSPDGVASDITRALLDAAPDELRAEGMWMNSSAAEKKEEDGGEEPVSPGTVASEDLIMCDVERNFVYSITPKRKAISRIQEASLVIYRLPGYQNRAEGTILVNLVHRKPVPQRQYFLHPDQPALFHQPILTLLQSSMTKQALYETVWRLVANLVPEFHVVQGVDHPWPFILKRVARDGQLCTRCSWLEGCNGCAVGDEKEILRSSGEMGLIDLEEEETLAIDWDSAVVKKHFNARANAPIDHRSIEEYGEKLLEPLSIEQCLDSFTKVEELDAYCPVCSKSNKGDFTETKQKKSLQIWAAPPVLVLQLKRFKTDGRNRGYKLNNLVTFPVEGFDLSQYVAEALHQDGDVTPGEPCTVTPGEPCTVTQGDAIASDSTGNVGEDLVSGASENGPPAAVPVSEYQTVEKMQHDVAEALHQDGDMTVEKMQQDVLEGKWGPSTLCRDDLVYDLYATVHHSGSLNGGHYTSHALVDSKWKHFNDASVSNASVAALQSSTAYILFYARRDITLAQTSTGELYPPCQSATVDMDQVRKSKWVPPRQQAVASVQPRLRRKSIHGDCAPGGCQVS